MRALIFLLALGVGMALADSGSGQESYREGLSGSDPELAFLIEGGTGKTHFPEIIMSQDMAQTWGASVFDPIHSFDDAHARGLILGVAGKSQPLSQDEQKLHAVHTLVDFGQEGIAPGKIIELIKGPYRNLQRRKLIEEVPGWVEALSPESEASFLQTILDEKFHGDLAAFRAELKKMRARSLDVSNTVSQRDLLQYLKDHPRVRKIYGLIGQRHLPFLDEVGEVQKSTADERHVRLQTGNGTVDVFLFGGEHGDLKHFRALLTALGEPPAAARVAPRSPADGRRLPLMLPPSSEPESAPPAPIDPMRCDQDDVLKHYGEFARHQAEEAARLKSEVEAYARSHPDANPWMAAREIRRRARPLSHRPDSPEGCDGLSGNSTDWDAVVAAVKSASDSTQMVKALRELRRFHACFNYDRVSSEGYPTTGWLHQFVDEESRRFGNNRCVGYWRNQIFCIMKIKWASRQLDLDSYFVDVPVTRVGPGCPRLQVSAPAVSGPSGPGKPHAPAPASSATSSAIPHQ